MGREINTLGSKINYAPMQQHVVQMKDELEKIKKQVGNTLYALMSALRLEGESLSTL